MAEQRQDRNILQIQPIKELKDIKDLKEYETKLAAELKELQRRLNEVFRRVSENILKLEGRSGESNVKSSIAIEGDARTLIDLDRGGLCQTADSTTRTLELAGGAHRDKDGQWIADDAGASILQLGSDGVFRVYSNTGLTKSGAFTPIEVDGSGFIGVRAHKSDNTSLTAGNALAIAFDVQDYDTSGFHSVSTNPTRFVVPTGLAGYYRVTGRAQFTMDATSSFRNLTIQVNAAGTSTAAAIAGRVIIHDGDLTDAAAYEVTTTVYLNDGDYVEFFIVSKQNCTVTAANLFYNSPSMEMYRIGS